MKRKNKNEHLSCTIYLKFPKDRQKSDLPIISLSKVLKDNSPKKKENEILTFIKIPNIKNNYILSKFNSFNEKQRKKKKIENIKNVKLGNSLMYYKAKKKYSNKKDRYNSCLKKNENELNSRYNLFINNFDVNRIDSFFFPKRKQKNNEDSYSLLRNKYNFFTMPKYMNDENRANKIKQIFNKKIKLELNNNNNNRAKIRSISQLKNKSFREKNETTFNNEDVMKKIVIIPNLKRKEIKKRKNPINSEIDNFIYNDLDKKEYYNFFSTSNCHLKMKNDNNKNEINKN